MYNKSCVSTKLWTNKQLWTGLLLSPDFWAPNQTTDIFCNIQSIDILIWRYFCVGYRGLKTENTYFVFRTILRVLNVYMHCLLPRRKSWLLCILFFKNICSDTSCTVTQLVFLEYFKVYSKHMSQKHMVNYWFWRR